MKKLILFCTLILAISSYSQNFFKLSDFKVAKLKNGTPKLILEKGLLMKTIEEKLGIPPDTYIDCSIRQYENGYFIQFFLKDSSRISVNLTEKKNYFTISGTITCASKGCAESATGCQPNGVICTDCPTNDCRRTRSN